MQTLYAWHSQAWVLINAGAAYMPDAKWKRTKANLLKKRFNQLWEEARAKNTGILTSADMERIANLMRIESREILDGHPLPPGINAALNESINILRPKPRTLHETIRITIKICIAGIILALIIIPAGSMLNVGVLKAMADSWAGKSTGGVWGHIGILAGAITLVYMMWKVSRKITPQRLAVQCQEIVNQAIRAWRDEN